MDDWKNRLVEEYRQLKERWEKLKDFNNKREITERLGKAFDKLGRCPTSEECREFDLRSCLMRDQQRAMGEYLHLLELRAELEGIKL